MVNIYSLGKIFTLPCSDGQQGPHPVAGQDLTGPDMTDRFNPGTKPHWTYDKKNCVQFSKMCMKLHRKDVPQHLEAGNVCHGRK